MSKNNKPFPKPVEVKEEEKKVVEEKTVEEAPKEEFGVVDGVTSMLNVRSKPEVGDNIVAQLYKGTKVKITERPNKDWFRIEVTDPKTEGYVMKKYITIS